MQKKHLIIVLLFLVPLPLYPWGFTAHTQVTRDAVSCLEGPLLSFFSHYQDSVAELAVVPDTRKPDVPEEYPRHFIDIDRYGDYPFEALPTAYTEAVRRFSADTITHYGTLPWWIARSVDSLAVAMSAGSDSSVIRWAGFLAHYVADAHQPLHTVLNYNGQLTGNDGIHRRYETAMVDMFFHEYTFRCQSLAPVRNPLVTAFEIIRESNRLNHQIITADDSATAHLTAVERQSFQQYYDVGKDSVYFIKLYQITDDMTWSRLRLAASRLAQLWEFAWNKAGTPNLRISSARK